jgi:xanthine dehydrogenase iron-sulfur cluster and FAD-binding subunit A
MVRFQADADFNQIIVAALVRKDPLVDFRTATVASLEGLRDGEVLALAASDKRILVTHDAKTMPRHFADFVQSHESAGVIVVPQHLPVSVVVDELLLIASATSPGEWTNRICYLPL